MRICYIIILTNNDSDFVFLSFFFLHILHDVADHLGIEFMGKLMLFFFFLFKTIPFQGSDCETYFQVMLLELGC